ncbi:MAG: hypothetical protein ACE5G8_16385 [Anaerolineae bacterium]
MARLRNGEKSGKAAKVERTLHRHFWGIRESELAEELGWGRRTLNNYLRRLQEDGKAYREGRSWFADK